MFDPETSLVHLLLHMNKDRFLLLLGYADIVRIVEKELIDWNRRGRWPIGGLDVHVISALNAVFETWV